MQHFPDSQSNCIGLSELNPKDIQAVQVYGCDLTAQGVLHECLVNAVFDRYFKKSETFLDYIFNNHYLCYSIMNMSDYFRR